MINISPPTLILQLLQLLLLIWILNRIMFRPLLRLINDRDQHIEKIKQDVGNIARETTDLVNKNLAMEKDARLDAGEERARLRQEANSQSELIFEETRKETEQIMSEAEKEIDGQVEKARDILHREVAVLAEEIIEKVMGRRVEA
jgi:F-type H+-transporting ATPase subunit b